MKRGYFVWDGDDDNAGIAVVESSAKAAKKIVYDSGELLWGDGNWIDIRVRWMRHAAVSSLPIGIVQDARDALIRGLYDSLMEYPCDECGKDADVVCHKGRALCECCIEREQRAETRDSGKMLLDAEVV
jgi:hypothetical protein